MKRSVGMIGIIAAIAVSVSCAVALTACDGRKPQTAEYTVTFLDGSSVLKTEKVESGGKATEWTPTKDGYTFEGWYATPNFSHTFKFDTEIKQDTSVFSQWASATQSADTRVYYIVGSGTSPILRESNWGKVFNDGMKMQKAADKNEYTYTVDLQKNDEFQFAINDSWHNQRGVGYMTALKLDDGTDAFSGTGTIGDNSSYRMNIKCELSGNYTFKLTTHPDDDSYETNHPQYTEANKEAFNINSLDKISWVRNGDANIQEEVVTDYYIKGAGITDWKDMYNAATKMTNTDGVFTLEVFLKQNEEFMFTSRNTIGSESSAGTEFLRSTNLDDAGKALFDETASKNMVAKATGTYKFTYTKATGVLTATLDATKAPAAADFYLDGTFAEGVADWSGYCFNADYKLAEKTAGSGVYEIKNVAMKADSEFIIQMFKAGATEKGEWGTDGYNGLGSFNYTYVFGGGDNFSAVGGNNNNIKVKVAGTYNITFDSYAKIITIEDVNAVNDAYIVGSMTGDGGWKVDAAWKMTFDKATKTYSITKDFAVDDGFGVRIMDGNSTTVQKAWYAAQAVSGSPAGFDISGSTITCKTAGRYTVTCTLTDEGATVAITATE